MDEPGLKQRLVAILVADAVGYSRLMSRDELGTVAALDAAREVFRREVHEARGRIVDMAGDSVLAIFDAAAGAATAALAIQWQLAALAADVPDDRRLHFRIGLHLGDVIEKLDGTVYGDGVNIAARLQALAEPGGIAVSDSIRTAVKGKIAGAFEDLGPQHVKNIADPIPTYRLESHDRAVAPAVVQPGPPRPDKPSIVVLPFATVGDDPEQEYLADGIAEDIITELSRFHRLFVIARNTSLTYRGQHADVKAVARELGVHFVLEGSVRRAGERVRVNARLVDGESGRQVWAERYEDVLHDVFELQERITRQIVGTMGAEIEEEEMRFLERGRRRFTDVDDLAWRASKALTDALFKGDPALTTEAIRLAERAIARDANCRLAWWVLSGSHAWRVFFGWTPDRAAAIEHARRAADLLMTLAPNDSRSYAARGAVAVVSGNSQAATADYRRAHELNPNDATILFFLSFAEAATGNTDRARALATQALRLSPKDRWLGVGHLALAMSAFIEGDLARLREWAELAIQSHPTAPIRRVLMIVYAAEVGDTALLRTHLDRLESVAPDFLPSLRRGDFRLFSRPDHAAQLLASLAKAERANRPG